MSDTAGIMSRLASVTAKDAGLRVLLLYGSRARGDAREDSDWDFGYLAAPDFDSMTLLANLVEALGSDRVDPRT